MKTTWKFPLAVQDDLQTFDLPKGSMVLSVAEQHERACLWCLVDNEVTETISVDVRIAGTGHSLDDVGEDWRFIGTVLLMGGSLVLHIFIRGA